MKLLIVDDEPALCEMVQAHLQERFECEVFTATTPAKALALLESELPDGMLLDIQLKSRLTGLDVLARVRELSPSTKVIMVTGVNDYSAVEKALELGAVDYVTKPFTVDYLEDTVASKIASHLLCA